MIHMSDCAIYNGPAYPAAECNCRFRDDGRPPIVCLPLMKIPARDAEKATKFLPEMWRAEKPNG